MRYCGVSLTVHASLLSIRAIVPGCGREGPSSDSAGLLGCTGPRVRDHPRAGGVAGAAGCTVSRCPRMPTRPLGCLLQGGGRRSDLLAREGVFRGDDLGKSIRLCSARTCTRVVRKPLPVEELWIGVSGVSGVDAVAGAAAVAFVAGTAAEVAVAAVAGCGGRLWCLAPGAWRPGRSWVLVSYVPAQVETSCSPSTYAAICSPLSVPDSTRPVQEAVDPGPCLRAHLASHPRMMASTCWYGREAARHR